MKTHTLFAAILCLLISGVSSNGQVPQLINYQGRVAVGATNFDGTGQFKFALVNADGGTTYWSNDGTSTAGGQPVDAVSLPVSKGIYAVLLGDATIPHMTVVPATVFSNNDVRLRVWFNDGSHDWRQLTPDQRIAAVGYALMAGNLPDGAITTPKIAAGAVGSAQIANGAVGSDQVAAGVVFAPQVVSGASQTAVANTSYVVTGTTAAAFTLPSTANLGDTIQITGANAGWSVLPFAWTESLTGGDNWCSITYSADGTKLFSCSYNNLIWASNDSGKTWRHVNDSYLDWTSITSSADGTKLAVCVTVGGQIYTSDDSGDSWTARATKQNWQSIASSADGTKLVACVEGGKIYTSDDSGATWTARETDRNWQAVASSADGTKLVACVGFYAKGQIYTSDDSGATWTARAGDLGDQAWNSVASSADGTKLVACVDGGQIYISTDSGATWTARASTQNWQSVTTSADGTKLAACVYNGQIYTSSDSGITWTARGILQWHVATWQSITSSADGTKLAVCGTGAQIFTAEEYSSPQGTTGSFWYAGDGNWVRVVEAP
jgi:photosystem II stability/assembly factor-like uncharacterized protein